MRITGLMLVAVLVLGCAREDYGTPVRNVL